MAQVNKESLREEFNKIKTQFHQQTKESHASKEIVALFNSLIMLFEIVMVIFLERKTLKTSKNSSKPPSQTGKDETSLTGGNHTKGKSEQDPLAANTRTVETETLLTVSECEKCGAPLQATPCQCIERRTRIDIIFEKTVEHFDAEVKRCDCGHLNKAKYPKGIHGPLQYGTGIQAYVIHLIVAQMISLNRTQKMLKVLMGKALSEATLLSYIMHLHLALAV